MLDLSRYPRLTNGIKLLSIGLMLGAIGLGIGRLWTIAQGQPWPPLLELPFWLASVAAIAHVIEGIAAGILASQQGENSLKTGLYTFFTGFVGLSETWQRRQEARAPLDSPLQAD